MFRNILLMSSAADGSSVEVTLVPEIGRFELKKMACIDVIDRAKACFERESR